MKPELPSETPSPLPKGYTQWSHEVIARVEHAKLQAALHVNTDMLTLYWQTGQDILQKQKQEGWGAQIIDQLSRDLTKRFSGDRGFSIRNLKEMRRFAKAYPHFPFVQVPLAQMKALPIRQVTLAKLESEDEFVQVPMLTQIHTYTPTL